MQKDGYPLLGTTSRLIEWTGERCVPWAPDVQVVYEHLHRYVWAAESVRGLRVLDLACGEGYGSAILARSAQSVVGVDVDQACVEHASLTYALPNVEFATADARELSELADHSFDVVVALEMIEHLGEQDRVLEQIRRVLAPGGLLIISTPNRDAYPAGSEKPNPFHVSELSEREFTELLSSRFANVACWRQQTITGSLLSAVGEAPEAHARTTFVERADERWQISTPSASPYLVALASDAELPAAPAESTLADPGLELLVSARRALHLQVSGLRSELHEQRQELSALRARTAHDAHTIASLDASLNAANQHLRRVEASVTWQLFQRLRGRLFSVLGGEQSHVVEVLQAGLRAVGRRLRIGTRAAGRSAAALRRARRPLGSGEIVLPEAVHPYLSIVIPLHAHPRLTRAALESIRENTANLDYEVILVDDAADRGTKRLLEHVRGAKVIVNDENLGYLRSIERAVPDARGRWLVLCNNDIEVEPGWLATMLGCGESAPNIGVVTPKFLYPDGTVAEAGAVTWRDGSGANYGRGADPECCHYEYRREVDYGSAAALLVRRDLWDAIGGFDERFLPMYYEDTDLCFEARSRGFRVVYEPRAEVIHVEGATAGVDVGAGPKRHQEQNRARFAAKWHDLLETEHLPREQGQLWRAANLRRQPHVLIADHRVPTWDRDSGGLRMRGMIEALLGLGAHVTLLPDNLVPIQPYTRELQSLGVEVLYRVDMARALERIGPSLSLAILSRPQVASRWLDLVRASAPSAIVAYDTVDLHWLREARQSSVDWTDGVAFETLSPKAAAMRVLELSMIRETDATIVVTDEERVHVLADVPQSTVCVLPNVNKLRASVPSAAGRRGVLFVGSFEHPPNIDGALMLVQEIMPLVWRQHADVPVTIVGVDPPPEIMALSSELVEVAGWVRDLDPMLDAARSMVAPLRYGAGMKGKVTQSLSAGLPVVTTPVGAEGLGALDGEHLLIGRDAPELARAIVRVIEDPKLWRRLSDRGQQLIAERCSPGVMSERMSRLLELAEPASARQRDRRQPDAPSYA